MRKDSRGGRVLLKVAGSKSFLRFGAPVVPALDRFVHRISGGRYLLSQGGVVPVMLLTTTGAKSGARRDVPLAYVPDGDVFYVVGSNYGRETHPAWTANLLRNPVASASVHGQQIDVRAHLLDDAEKRAVWPKLVDRWPNYDVYTERSGRDLRVFRLDRIDGTTGRARHER